MFSIKWNDLVNNFRLDIGWKMVNLNQSEYDLFDNMEVFTLLHVFSKASFVKSWEDFQQDAPKNFGQIS